MQHQKLREQTKEQGQFLTAIDRKLSRVIAQLAAHGEVLAALVDHLGKDVINAKLDDLRTKRRVQHEEELEKSVQFMLDNEMAKMAEEGTTIGPDIFIVSDEVSPDGTKVRVQHELAQLDETGQARYLGKKVGDTVTVKGATTKVVIRALYILNRTKIQEVALKQKAAAQAQAAIKAAVQAPIPLALPAQE